MYKKWTTSDFNKIKSYIYAGYSAKDIAGIFGVSRVRIYQVIKKMHCRCIKGKIIPL